MSHHRGNIHDVSCRYLSVNLYIGGRCSLAAPARVVSEEPDGRLLWISHGSPIWRINLPEGVHLRDIPVDASLDGRQLIADEWHRDNALVWQPAAGRYAVWLLFNAGGFRRWYVNMEHRRDRPGRVDVFDHELDIEVAADRTWRWKDVASFDTKIGEVGYWSPEEADLIRAQAVAVTADIDAGRGPFDDRWRDFRPDADWARPKRLARPPLRQPP